MLKLQCENNIAEHCLKSALHVTLAKPNRNWKLNWNNRKKKSSSLKCKFRLQGCFNLSFSKSFKNKLEVLTTAILPPPFNSKIQNPNWNLQNILKSILNKWCKTVTGTSQDDLKTVSFTESLAYALSSSFSANPTSQSKQKAH